jgi:hypothetical protein
MKPVALNIEYDFDSPEIQSFADRVTLTHFKHCDFASQETLCFEATVCIDGKPVAHASNDGHGGMTNVMRIPNDSAAKRILDGFDRTIAKYAWIEGCSEWSIDHVVDYVANAEVDKVERHKWMMSQTRKAILFSLEGDSETTHRTVKRRVGVSKKQECLIEENRIVKFIVDKYGDAVTSIDGLRYATFGGAS